MRRVTKDGLIATIGFEVALFAPHQGTHVAFGSCDDCQRTGLELKRLALSIVPRWQRGCFYQIFEPAPNPWGREGSGSGSEVCVVLRALSREIPVGVAQLGCLRSIEEALRRLGGARRV